MVGDFEKQMFPAVMQSAVTTLLRSLYELIGLGKLAETFHMHKEDPKTTHKSCPGKNCGDRVAWISRVANFVKADHVPVVALAGVTPAPEHAVQPYYIPVPAGTVGDIATYEALRLTAYPDGFHKDGSQRFAIGYGTNIKPDGTFVVEGETCTEEQAKAWLVDHVTTINHEVQDVVHAPITPGVLRSFDSFVYNLGLTNFHTSGMLKSYNSQDFDTAATIYLTWDVRHDATGAKVHSAGLHTRRRNELMDWIDFVVIEGSVEHKLAMAASKALKADEPTSPVPGFSVQSAPAKPADPPVSTTPPVPATNQASETEPTTHSNPQENNMDNTKPWWTSQTIWGGIGAVVGGAWATYASLKSGDVAGAVANAQNTATAVAGVAAIFGGLQAIIGRFKATAAIGKK